MLERKNFVIMKRKREDSGEVKEVVKDLLDKFKGVNPRSTKKLKIGKRKSIKRDFIGVNKDFQKKETCLLFSGMNLINIFRPKSVDTTEKRNNFYKTFVSEYDHDDDGVYSIDIFDYIKYFLKPKTNFTFRFGSNLKGLKDSDDFYSDYMSLKKSQELIKFNDNESERIIKDLLLQNYAIIIIVHCNKSFRCIKCSKRVPFAFESTRTHSVVLLSLTKDEKYIFYIDSEVIVDKYSTYRTCNYCKVMLKNILTSLPSIKEFIAVKEN